MPIHDWTRVPAGIFHHFHTYWIPDINSVLNDRLLPREYYAFVEQVTGDWSPDVLTLQTKNGEANGRHADNGSTATLVKTSPKVRFTAKADGDIYHLNAKQIAIRHVSDDRLVAVLEIVSPGNKANLSNLETFVDKVAGGLARGVHFLVVDLFTPTSRDPNGIHAEIWRRFSNIPFELPADQPLTTVAYEAGAEKMAYIEPLAVGDPLSPMPLYLETDKHVAVPLEETYQSAWRGVPERWRAELAPS